MSVDSSRILPRCLLEDMYPSFFRCDQSAIMLYLQGVHADEWRIDSVALKRVTSATLEKLTGGRDGDYWRQRLIACWRACAGRAVFQDFLMSFASSFFNSYFFIYLRFALVFLGSSLSLCLSPSLPPLLLSVRPNQARLLCHSLDAICLPSSPLGHSDQRTMSIHTDWALYNSNLQSKTLLSFQGPEDCERQTFKLEICLSISLFHRAFFNSIMDKTPTHALFYSTLY